jgi:thioester reductase-like protein/predicted lipid carrier protein YhbT
MTVNGTVLVTGVTGSIGSWMTRKFLDDGWRVIALVRADSLSAAGVRARNALDVVGAADYASQMEVIQGDVCQDDLGVRLIPRCRDASLIVHCAGVLEFGPEFAELNHRVNVLGTANLLQLAEALKVPFCHFSTAYIAGKRRGRVFEKEIDVGQEFHNAYESSKCQAEMVIQNWAARTGLDVFVFRPSIIVGDSKAGRIVNFDGLYSFMRLLDSIAGTIGTEEFRVAANPDATKNFVPADYVADVAWHILKAGSPGTYHITNTDPMPVSTLRDIFVDLFAIPGARLADEEEFRRKKPSKLEWMYRKAADSYAPYLAAEARFDRTNTDTALNGANARIPQMNAAFFRMLLSYARQVNWGRTNRPAPAPVFRQEDAGAAESRQRFVERYFSHFLAEQMHKQLLPNLRNLSATCGIVVEDIPGRSWSLSIDRGRLEQISKNGENCQCTFFLASDVFSSIVSGQLAPQQAFFEKNINIEGDIETGMRLATVLAAFFRKWPYHSGMCHAR